MTIRTALQAGIGRRSGVFGWAAAGVLAGLVIGSCQSHPELVIPAGQPYAVQVSFKNCGKPYPCEVIENTSGEPVTLTVTNSYQHEVIVVPAHGSVTVALDESDNR